MRPDNPAPIIAAARHRHELTRARAIQAIRELDRAGTPVTFAGVAGQAGISRSWLYSQPDIRDQIAHLRDATRRSGPAPIPASQRASDVSLLRRLEAAHAANRAASWKSAHGSVRRTPGSAGRSPAPSANSGRPGSPASNRSSNSPAP